MIRRIDNIVLLDNHVESNGEIYLYCSFETSRKHSVKYIYIYKRVRLGECQAYKGCACASRCGLTALQHYLLCYFVTLCLLNFRFCSNETFPLPPRFERSFPAFNEAVIYFEHNRTLTCVEYLRLDRLIPRLN